MMCIIIDANSLSKVFCVQNKQHKPFKPVLDWIIQGRGKIVFGGTKYREELVNCYKFVRIMTEFDKAGKVVRICDEEVDKKEKQLITRFGSNQFNDFHIVAIVIVSGCRLVCSTDKDSHTFLKEKSFYPRGFKRPCIYLGHPSNVRLLCDKYIVDICRPYHKLAKTNANRIGRILR